MESQLASPVQQHHGEEQQLEKAPVCSKDSTTKNE